MTEAFLWVIFINILLTRNITKIIFLTALQDVEKWLISSVFILDELNMKLLDTVTYVNE